MAERLGIGVMAFDRPHYLSETLAALAANDLRGCDVWLFLDGAICPFTNEERAKQDDIDACAALFQSAFPRGRVVRQEYNAGIARHRLAVLETLAHWYGAFIQLEDDVVLAPRFIALARKLLAEHAADGDVGIIASPIAPPTSPDWQPNALYQKQAHVSAVMARREWFAPVLALYRQYCDLIAGYPYTPHEPYQDAVEALIGGGKPCSSDGALWWATEESGRLTWVMGAPRAKSIGVEGVHSRPSIYERLHMGDVVLRDYEGEMEMRWEKHGEGAA